MAAVRLAPLDLASVARSEREIRALRAVHLLQHAAVAPRVVSEDDAVRYAVRILRGRA